MVGDAADILNAIAWPVVVLIGVLAVVFSGTLRTWLVQVVQRVRKVSALGVDVDLTPEVSTEVREVTEEAFRTLRQRINREFDSQIHVHELSDKRNRLVEEHIRPLLARYGAVPDFRSTIYVEDVLFTETLYQLLDYYPRYPGRRGRTIPIRFGIVGRAWRSREDQLEPDVPTEAERLIREWGMTWDQAASAGHGRHSFACVLIREERGGQVGAIYLDAPERAAFGDTDDRRRELAETVRAGAEQSGLTRSIQATVGTLRSKSPFISIYFDE